MATLDVGIIGVGGIAEIGHIPAYMQSSHTQITSIADVDDNRRQEIASGYDIPNTYADGESLLQQEDVDIVSICTPPKFHEQIFIKAARQGTHIFVEKPLAVDLEAAERMQSAAQEYDVFTQVGYAKRYTNNYQKVLTFIQNGMLGDIYEATLHLLVVPPTSSWRYDPDIAGGGIITENLPHWLDYYMLLFDGTPSVTRSKFDRINTTNVEDFAEITLSFDEVNLNIVAKWIEPGFTYKALLKNTIVGINGELEFDQERLEGNIRGKGFYFKHGETPSIALGPLFQAWYGVSENTFTKAVADFIDYVAVGEQPVASIDWGVEVSKVKETIYEKGGGR